MIVQTFLGADCFRSGSMPQWIPFALIALLKAGRRHLLPSLSLLRVPDVQGLSNARLQKRASRNQANGRRLIAAGDKFAGISIQVTRSLFSVILDVNVLLQRLCRLLFIIENFTQCVSDLHHSSLHKSGVLTDIFCDLLELLTKFLILNVHLVGVIDGGDDQSLFHKRHPPGRATASCPPPVRFVPFVWRDVKPSSFGQRKRQPLESRRSSGRVTWVNGAICSRANGRSWIRPF